MADVKNTFGIRYGGGIGAALFLEEFVGDHPWVHIDIAGPAFMDDTELRSLVEALGGQPGATGDGALAFAAADGVVGAARHHGTTAIVVTGGGGVDPDVVAAVAQSHAST